MGNSFSEQTLKVKLKMASQRVTMYTSKKNNEIKQQRRQVAQLLAQGKDENARIRCEGILQTKRLLACVEALSLMCELLVQRLSMITRSRTCPPDLLESVASILYASDRIAGEIPELAAIAQQFALKYTKEWAYTHVNNESTCVSARCIKGLSAHAPKLTMVITELKGIAAEHNIDWEPDLDATAEEKAADANVLGAIVALDGQDSNVPPTGPVTVDVTTPSVVLQQTPSNLVVQQQVVQQPLHFPGTLNICIHSVANLSSGVNTTALVQHPYVRLMAAGMSSPVDTSVDHNGGVEPEWGEYQYPFQMTGIGLTINLSVFNQDQMGDLAIGHATLNGDALARLEGKQTWVPITDAKNNSTPRGQVLVSAVYQHVEMAEPGQMLSGEANFTTPQQPVYNDPPPVFEEAKTADDNGFINSNNDTFGEQPVVSNDPPDFDELENRFNALKGL